MAGRRVTAWHLTPTSVGPARQPVAFLAGSALIGGGMRIVDGLFCYLVAFVTVLASARRLRLGDMAARTLVVRG